MGAPAQVLADGRALGAAPLDVTLPAISDVRRIELRVDRRRVVRVVEGDRDVSLTVPRSRTPHNRGADAELRDPFNR
jgi:hypothetical protein